MGVNLFFTPKGQAIWGGWESSTELGAREGLEERPKGVPAGQGVQLAFFISLCGFLAPSLHPLRILVLLPQQSRNLHSGPPGVETYMLNSLGEASQTFLSLGQERS